MLSGREPNVHSASSPHPRFLAIHPLASRLRRRIRRNCTSDRLKRMSASQSAAQAPAAASAPASAASTSTNNTTSPSTSSNTAVATSNSTSGDLRRVKSGLSCAECRRCAYISLPCVNHRRLGLSNLLRSPSSPTTLLHITDSDYVLCASCPASDIQFKAQV